MNAFSVEVLYPTNRMELVDTKTHIITMFLAGSIEQGKAEDWQSRITKDLNSLESDTTHEDSPTKLILFNPRRPDWNPNLPQDALNSILKEQIEWELEHLEKADIICLYLDPNTSSPISLLEMGLHMKSGKMVVCCPVGFYRKANVDLTCNKYGVKVYSEYSELFKHLSEKIMEKNNKRRS